MDKLMVLCGAAALGLVACAPGGTVPPTTVSGEAAVAPAIGRADPDPDATLMLRLVLERLPAGLREISRVEAPSTLNRRSPPARGNAYVDLLDARGALIERRWFEIAGARAVEAPGPDGRWEREAVAVETTVFSVAVPAPEALALLRFYELTEAREARLLGEVRR